MMDYGKLASTLTLAEGKKRSVYQDSQGYWTIGVGHLVDAKMGAGLSEAAIQFILKEDMANSLADVINEPFYKACDTDARQRAIVELVFMLGHSKLRQFTTFLAMISKKNWTNAAQDLLATALAKQLPERVGRIAKQISTGVD
jgi:lysozyme